MYRKFTLSINDVEVAAKIVCDFSVCLSVEFWEEGKSLLPSGYKNVILGMAQFPERTIEEKESAVDDVLAVAEWLFGVRPTLKRIGESVEEPGDNERFTWWRKFLGVSYFKEEQSEKQQPVQLELSFL